MLARLCIREKVAAALAVLALTTCLLGGFALQRFLSLSSIVTEITTNWLPSVQLVGGIAMQVQRHRNFILTHILESDPARLDAVETDIADAIRMIEATRARYVALLSSPEETATYQEFSRRWAAYLGITERITAMSRGGDDNAARALYRNEALAEFRQSRIALDRLVEINAAGAGHASDVAATEVRDGAVVILGVLGLGLLVAFGAGAWILRGIRRDIAALTGPMERLAAGDLDAALPALPARTEMGGCLGRLAVFKAALLAQREAGVAAAAEAEAKARRAEALGAMIARFEANAGGAFRTVAAALAELEQMAGSMTETARRGETQAEGVAHAAGEASHSVGTVASAAEELGASITEITRQVSATAQIARQAAESAAASNATVTALSDSAQRIGDVVRLISDIAAQTNLLALNATIESARAGEHGKGFAVVAGEVKQLAAQTAKATEEIGAQIGAMQSQTTASVQAIREIGARIGKVESIAVQVAAAAEQQSAATQEIIRAVSGAAAGTEEVARFAGDLTQGATATGAAATQLRASAAELARQSDLLRGEVDGFLDGVRAA